MLDGRVGIDCEYTIVGKVGHLESCPVSEIVENSEDMTYRKR